MTEAEVDKHLPSQGCFESSFDLNALVRLNSKSMANHDDARTFMTEASLESLQLSHGTMGL